MYQVHGISFRSLKTALFPLQVSRTEGASDWCAQQEALYKCTDTIEYGAKHASHNFIDFLQLNRKIN